MFLGSQGGNRIALCCPDREPLTFEVLQKRIDRHAGQLRAAGVGRSSRVGLIPSTGADALIALLAIMRCGVALPLDPSYRDQEARKQLSSLRLDFLLTDPHLPDGIAESARVAGVRTIGFPADDSGATFPAGPEPLPGDTALVLLTSGAAGRPKRVPLTHGNLAASARHIRQSLQLGCEDRFLCIARLHHVAGIALALASLSAGSTTFCAPGLHPAAFFEHFDAFRPTWFWAAPAILLELLPRAEARGEHLRGGRLRFIRSGSAPLPPRTLARAEAAFGVPVLENYGMTEASPQITSSPLPPQRRKPGSAGIAAGPELRIVDQDGAAVPPGAQGEIQIRGDNVMNGYEDNPEADADAFADGWFRTGDVGRLDSEGYLHLLGRRDDVINRGGEKVWPREVEEVLLSHPGVAEAVVFPVAHEGLSADVAAAVVAQGEPPGETELRRFVAARMARFKAPSRIVVVAAIPKAPGGKPQRRSLAAELGIVAEDGRKTVDAAFCEASTPLEKQLAAIWARILQVERVGARDDFFALGGDSLAVTAMLTEVERQLGCGNGLIQRVDFFDAPTIDSQACSLEKALRAAGAAAKVEPARRLPEEISYVSPRHAGSLGSWRADDRRPPIFIVPWADSDGLYLSDMASALGEDWPFCVLANPDPHGKPYTIEALAQRFVPRILEAQPEGPYVLAGHCFGAHVAYEIAGQLQAAGRQVRLLAILDSPRPAYPGLIRHGHLFAAGGVFHLWQAIRNRNTAARIRSAARSLIRHVWKHGKGRIERIAVDLGSGSSLRAMRMYRPTPLRAPALVLISRDHPQTGSPLDRRVGWLELIEPRPAFAVVEGDHGSILAPEYVAGLAEHLARMLAPTDAAATRFAPARC